MYIELNAVPLHLHFGVISYFNGILNMIFSVIVFKTDFFGPHTMLTNVVLTTYYFINVYTLHIFIYIVGNHQNVCLIYLRKYITFF